MLKRLHSKRIIRWVLSIIESANDAETDQIVQAVIRRYGTIYPGWEIIFLSLPKDDAVQRRRMLENILQLEAKEKKIKTTT